MRRYLGYIVGIGVIILLVVMVQSKDLYAALSQLTWDDVARLLLISVAMLYVSAFKWRVLLDYLGGPIPVVKLVGFYLVGYFVNSLLPSHLGGDAVRSWYAGRKIGQHQAFAATILERYTGLLAMLVLALGSMWFVEGVTIQIKLAVVALAIGLGVITIIAVSPRLLSLVKRVPRLHATIGHLERVQAGLRIGGSNPPLLAKALALSFLFHSLTVVNTLWAGYAVGWYNAPIAELFLVLPLILLIGALPISPSGLGVQEGAFFFFLQMVGASPAQALGVGLVLRAKFYLLGLSGGLVWFLNRDRERAPVTAG